MPRGKRPSSPFDPYDDDFDEDTSSQSSKNGNPPVQRNAANARERARMRVLSSAFGRLKTKLPNIPPDTKLSKLDTLRLATMYIKQLKVLVEGAAGGAENQQILQESAGIFGMQGISQSMTWPFGFHNIQQNGCNNNNRQQTPHQYSTTEWNSERNTCNKYERTMCNGSNGNSNCNNNNYIQNSMNQLHTHHWYTTVDRDMAEESNVDSHSTFNQSSAMEQQRIGQNNELTSEALHHQAHQHHQRHHQHQHQYQQQIYHASSHTNVQSSIR